MEMLMIVSLFFCIVQSSQLDCEQLIHSVEEYKSWGLQEFKGNRSLKNLAKFSTTFDISCLTNLKHLGLASNSIINLNIATPESHTGFRYDVIMINVNALVQVNQTFFVIFSKGNFSSLDLSDNFISLKDSSFYGLYALNRLDLSSNGINLRNEVIKIRGLEGLKELMLTLNGINDITNVTFQGLRNLEVLDLSQNGIMNIANCSIQGLSHLKTLELTSNSISSLARVSFKGIASLARLYLDDNEIASFENCSFQGLTSLKYLKIGENPFGLLERLSFQGVEQLDTLSIGGFESSGFQGLSVKGLPNLRRLELIRANIETVNWSFEGLDNLRVLHIVENPIFSLDECRVSGLTNLETLTFYMTWIYSLEHVSCKGLESLKTLRITNGFSISSIRNVQLNGFDNVTTLDLSFQAISELGEEVRVSGLPRLENLILVSNSLAGLGRTHFFGIELLRFLDLSYNMGITSLDNVKFTGLPELAYLNVSHNHIRKLSNYDISPKLATLNLENNPLDTIEFNTSPRGTLQAMQTLFSYKIAISDFLDYPTEIYTEYKSYVLIHFDLSALNASMLNSHSEAFFRKRVYRSKKNSKFFSMYQSVPVKVKTSNNNTLKNSDNCQLIMSLYRECKFLRLFIGDRLDYEHFIEKCSQNVAGDVALD